MINRLKFVKVFKYSLRKIQEICNPTVYTHKNTWFKLCILVTESNKTSAQHRYISTNFICLIAYNVAVFLGKYAAGSLSYMISSLNNITLFHITMQCEFYIRFGTGSVQPGSSIFMFIQIHCRRKCSQKLTDVMQHFINNALHFFFCLCILCSS